MIIESPNFNMKPHDFKNKSPIKSPTYHKFKHNSTEGLKTTEETPKKKKRKSKPANTSSEVTSSDTEKTPHKLQTNTSNLQNKSPFKTPEQQIRKKKQQKPPKSKEFIEDSDSTTPSESPNITDVLGKNHDYSTNTPLKKNKEKKLSKKKRYSDAQNVDAFLISEQSPVVINPFFNKGNLENNTNSPMKSPSKSNLEQKNSTDSPSKIDSNKKSAKSKRSRLKKESPKKMREGEIKLEKKSPEKIAKSQLGLGKKSPKKSKAHKPDRLPHDKITKLKTMDCEIEEDSPDLFSAQEIDLMKSTIAIQDDSKSENKEPRKRKESNSSPSKPKKIKVDPEEFENLSTGDEYASDDEAKAITTSKKSLKPREEDFDTKRRKPRGKGVEVSKRRACLVIDLLNESPVKNKNDFIKTCNFQMSRDYSWDSFPYILDHLRLSVLNEKWSNFSELLGLLMRHPGATSNLFKNYVKEMTFLNLLVADYRGSDELLEQFYDQFFSTIREKPMKELEVWYRQ